MFRINYPVQNLRPAPYNPRAIDEESAQNLRDSLQSLGLLKALIVSPDGLLLAGHQRTNAWRSLGCKFAPTQVLQHAVTPKDQARFNQLHNACDLDFAANDISIHDTNQLFQENYNGWVEIAPERIIGHVTGYANEKREICDLLAKFGPWGNAIALDDGRIIVGGLYAYCCALMGMPCLVSVVATDDEPLLRQFFGKSYGRFDYGNVQRETWRQSFAQMHRLLGGDASKKAMKSRTYENLVIPLLEENSTARVLDFGAGQMDYVRKLRDDGYSIWGYEPYFRNGHDLDIEAVRNHVREICDELRTNGLFDIVVADSVINSVDTQQAEDNLMLSLGALCKPSGTIIFSGRNRDDQRLGSDELRKQRTGKTTNIGFFDDNGLTALPRRNGWQFQKFHSLPEVAALSQKWFGSEAQIFDQEGKKLNGTKRFHSFDRPAWAAKTTNIIGDIAPQRYVDALRREFDLPYPSGSVGMANTLLYAHWEGSLITEAKQGLSRHLIEHLKQSFDLFTD